MNQIEEQLDDRITIDKCVAFDQRAFKQSLVNECGKLRQKYQQLLLNLVSKRLFMAEEFIEQSEQILSKVVPLKQLESLLSVMSVIRDIHNRNATINQDSFGPLINDMEFFKDSQVEINDDVIKRVKDTLVIDYAFLITWRFCD